MADVAELERPTIRPEIAADIAAIANLTRRAFDKTNGEEVQMVADFRARADFIPEFSLVAELGGMVVGHVITVPSILRGDEGNTERPRRVLLLGPLSVLPEFQRRGMGGQLLRRTLEVVACRPDLSGSAPMIVLWGHSDYYPRFGFRPARELGLRPDDDAAMVYPLREDLSEYAGLELPD